MLYALALAATALMAPPGPQSVTLERIGPYLTIPSVYLNGNGPFRLLLDTGSASSEVSVEAAARAGIVPRARVQRVTVSGESLAPIGFAVVAVGELRLAPVEMMIGRLERVRRLDRRIDGVLGQNFLRRNSYLIDVAGGRLVIGGTRISGEPLPFRWSDGRVSVQVDVDDRPEWLVLDSGTPSLVLFRAGPLVGRPVRLFTANGGASAVARGVVLRVGSSQARDAGAVVVSGSRGGLLPLSRFRAIYVDPQTGFVVLDQ